MFNCKPVAYNESMDALPFSLESLRCFVEAARLLNFRAAARAVALTPAALGQRIRQLEEQLDCKLFHRTTRNVTLTQEGLALRPYAERVLSMAKQCVSAARGELAPPDVDLVMGTRHELGLSWVVPMMGELEQRFPTVTMHLYFGSGSHLLSRVRALEIDCAITSTRLMDPKLAGFQLHREDYVFVASPSLLREKPLDSTSDASSHTLVDINETHPLFRYWRDAPDGVADLSFGKVRVMGTIEAVYAMVIRGQGCAVLPRYFVAADLEAGNLTTLFPDAEPLHDYFRLVFRADDPRRSLYEALAKAMGEYPLK